MKHPLILFIFVSLAFSHTVLSSNPSELLTHRNLSSTIQDELVNGSPCNALTVIFARGTGQAGNMGEYPGPQFVHETVGLIGKDKLSVQGLNYSAKVTGFLKGGDTDGASMLSNLTMQILTQCPNTNLVLGGYRYAYPMTDILHQADWILQSRRSGHSFGHEQAQSSCRRSNIFK